MGEQIINSESNTNPEQIVTNDQDTSTAASTDGRVDPLPAPYTCTPGILGDEAVGILRTLW